MFSGAPTASRRRGFCVEGWLVPAFPLRVHHRAEAMKDATAIPAPLGTRSMLRCAQAQQGDGSGWDCAELPSSELPFPPRVTLMLTREI